MSSYDDHCPDPRPADTRVCGAFQPAAPRRKPYRCTEAAGHDCNHRAVIEGESVGEWAPDGVLQADATVTAGWVVARDGGRSCETCDQEIRRGEAYVTTPGVDELHHIHCPGPAMATEYTICALPEGDINHGSYAITVAYRGDGRWAVLHHRWCLGTDGVWDFEMRPSEREDEWLDAHRFDLDTALRLAAEAAPGVEVNGITAAEVAARRKGGPAHA